LVLAQDAASLPTAAPKYQVDQGLKISPVELPDHAKANFAHLDPECGGLRMDRVSFITSATQQIIRVLIVSSFANRFLAMTRWPGRSAFASIVLGFVCLAIYSPNAGIFSPRRRQTKEMARATGHPDQRISRGYKLRAGQAA
jgi:hypothetical protein